ncbi:unnamed protein product [Amoebophrya sp. A25]|nr:unnamed protein product [Amoebophrya sp. A25]|eukprot:GSA25T00015888001.1
MKLNQFSSSMASVLEQGTVEYTRRRFSCFIWFWTLQIQILAIAEMEKMTNDYTDSDHKQRCPEKILTNDLKLNLTHLQLTHNVVAVTGHLVRDSDLVHVNSQMLVSRPSEEES